ncbi:MAG: DMT family transporter [Gammaproteobacteria bacterium]|nr:MAG: DMT family transporter [Gammaproteobacteria bacterium]
MSPEIAALVLLAALLHALWNALVKAGLDSLLILASVALATTVTGALMIPFFPPPAPASWLYILLSSVLHYGYYLFLLQAYRFGDLSHVYPMARGIAPLLVAGGAALFAHEFLSATATAGVALASIGITSLAFAGGPPWKSDARPLLFALGTSVFIAAYSVVDGVGVRLSNSPFGYMAWLFLLEFPFPAVALYRCRRRIVAFVRTQWKSAVGAGVTSVGAYALVIYAVNFAPMASVSALRESSVIIAALIGTLLLGEPSGWRRVGAAVMVVAGVALLTIG